VPLLIGAAGGMREGGAGRKFQPREVGSGRSRLDTSLLVPIVVVLTFVASINALQGYLIYFRGEKSLINLARYLASNLLYSWYFLLTVIVVMRLSGRFRPKKRAFLRWGAIHLSAMGTLTIAHQVLSLILDRELFHFQRPATVFGVLLNNPAVWGDIVAYVLFLLGFYMLEYRRTNREYELEYSRLETVLAKTKLRELRGRVHPDFLLDTLDALRSLLRAKQNKKANSALSQLSEFLRITVYDRDRDEVTLNEEVVLTNRYIELENLRLTANIRVTERITDDARNAVVPSFLLQPIVEELVRFNLAGGVTRFTVELTAGTRERLLEISVKVRNGGVSREDWGAGGDGALSMTKERLARLYGERHEFSVDAVVGGTVIVGLKIPLNVNMKMEEPV
jgi:two-component system, LytTR family, sensor kinase